MINKTLPALFWTALAASTMGAQPPGSAAVGARTGDAVMKDWLHGVTSRSIFSSGGAGSREGWQLVYTAIAKPPGLKTRIHTDVTYTEEAGQPLVFHRFFIDPSTKTYVGYDVVVEPGPVPNVMVLRFRPLSLRADQLPKEYDAAGFRPLELPLAPGAAFMPGQIIAVDALENPATGQKVVDYIQVKFEPNGESAPKAAARPAARDFQVGDVLLHFVVPELRVNGQEFAAAVAAASRVNASLVWLSVPERGRFLLSLSARPGFQNAGVMEGRALSFTWEGQRYEVRSHEAFTESYGSWNLYVLAAPPPAGISSAAGFGFGSSETVEQFLSEAR